MQDHTEAILFLLKIFGDLFTPYDYQELKKIAYKEHLSRADLDAWQRCTKIAQDNCLLSGGIYDE